jgi:hypothetical protein
VSRSWALETATNPSVLRIHVGHELTDRTIVTSPPAEVAMPLAGLLEVEAVRTIDLHRYRVRVNLAQGADRRGTEGHIRDILRPSWGAEEPLPDDPEPRAFEARHPVPREVAESAEMAAGHPLLEGLFGIDGVSEAIAGDDVVLIRLGRLFTWQDVQPFIERAVVAHANRSRDGIP